jgi:hypothetical protein
MSIYQRSYKELGRDLPWCMADLTDKDDQRSKAAIDIMRRIPGEDFKKLKTHPCEWYLPIKNNLGEVKSFNQSKIIYLSPELENMSFDRVKAVVAHELAHVVLNHDLQPGEKYKQQEDEAWGLASQWGLEQEVKKHLTQREIERR